MGTATQIRTCQVGACSERVPANLGPQGVCLVHYLDQAFTRVSAALELCRLGKELDSRTMAWLKDQGDFAVKLLAGSGPIQTSEERARLLELLLCLANAREYMRQHSTAKI